MTEPNELSAMLAERVALKQTIEYEAKVLTDRRKELDDLDANIRAALRTTGLDSVTKDGYRATVERKVGTRVPDWEALFAYIRGSGDFHLLQRRLTVAPFAELHGQGEAIPGVETYEYDELSVRKVSSAATR